MLNLLTLLIIAALSSSIFALPEKMPDPSVIPNNNEKLQLKAKFWTTTDCHDDPTTERDLLQEEYHKFYIDKNNHAKGLYGIRSFKINRDMLRDEYISFFQGPDDDPCSRGVNVLWYLQKKDKDGKQICLQVGNATYGGDPVTIPAKCVKGARWVYTTTTESSVAATPTAH